MNAGYWLGNLAAWSAQMAAVVAAAGMAAWLFGLRAPRIRLAYWQVLLGICLLLPAVEPWRRALDSDIQITTGIATAVAGRRAPVHLPWREALLLIMAAGCAGRAIWLAAGLGKLRRWRRDAKAYAPLPARLAELREAIAPEATVQLSAAVSGPVTFGWRRPVVMLPDEFQDLPAAIQEAVVCHELLHVRRGDWMVTLVEQAIRAALWFHPAVWWVIGQIQLTREQTVDSEVVALTRNRQQYLNALLAMAGDRPALDLAPAALFLRKRHLKNRVALLLKENTMSKRKLISFCATSCGVLLAAGWLALHTFPLKAAPVPQDESGKLLHSVPPVYPEAARAKHIEGAVTMEVHIDGEGHVTDAKVLSGAEELRSAALAAILQWHYSPKAMTLPTTTQVTMTFKLPAGPAPAAPPDTMLEGKRLTLEGITVEGLAPAAREELLQRMPVHQGDVLDAQGMRDATAAVQAFDEHLRLVLLLNPADENSGRLRVMLPPAGTDVKRLRVGGNVQQAKLITKVQPVYPAEAKAQRIQGIVKLQATLGRDGKVENLEVLSGDPLLAAAAIEAVRQWQYQTTLLNGDPVEVVTQVDVNFTLSQ